MTKTRATKKFLIFCCGILCGIGVTFLFLFFFFLLDPHKRELRSYKTFCDSRIDVYKQPDSDEQKPYRMLAFQKNTIPFMYIYADENNKVCKISIVRFDAERPNVVFSMETDQSSGQWTQADYGNFDPQNSTFRPGYGYEDIDFDGNFDIKFLLNEDGKSTSASIFLNDQWLQVEHWNAEKRLATVNKTLYIFAPEHGGWQQLHID